MHMWFFGKSREYWEEMSDRKDLTNQFIKDNRRKLNFTKILKNYPDLSLDIVDACRNHLDWDELIVYHDILPQNFLDLHWNHLDWKNVSMMDLSFEKLLAYGGFLDWDYLTTYKRFGEKRIELVYEFLNKKLMCEHQRLSCEFIDEHWLDLRFYKIEICKFQRLSVSFMRKHAASLPWLFVCEHQILSSAFMDEMSGYFDDFCWVTISEKQKMTKEFILKYRNNLNMSMIILRQDLEIPWDDFPDDDKNYIKFIKERKLWQKNRMT